MDFTQNNNFRNALDVKSLIVEKAYRGVIADDRVDNMLNEIKEKQMETLEEYKAGCRESNIRALTKDEHIGILAERVAQYGSEEQYSEVKKWLLNYVIEHQLVDEDEL